MKARFSILDIRAALAEINQHLVGQYVVNIYDIDNKTYLIKLRTSEDKKILLFESGMRVHMTEMEWPKSNGKSQRAISVQFSSLSPVRIQHENAQTSQG